MEVENVPEEKVEPKIGIIIDANPETGKVEIGGDIDGDGKPDISINIIIKSKLFWTILSIAVAITLFTKAIGLW